MSTSSRSVEAEATANTCVKPTTELTVETVVELVTAASSCCSLPAVTGSIGVATVGAAAEHCYC